MNGTMRMDDNEYTISRTNFTSVPFTVAGSAAAVLPLASSTMCNAANVRIQLTGTDNGCNPSGLVYTVDDSRLQISASGLITNRPGQPLMRDPATPASAIVRFTVTATTACGISVKQTFSVTLTDNMTPNTVCKVFTTATLDDNGFVRVPLSAFENGSSDNCGIERQMVRRMTNSTSQACNTQGQIANTDCWNDYVDFTCADLGDTDPNGGQLMVALRSVDAAGNTSDCMVRIEKIDKTKPSCVNQPAISFPCTDLRLSNYRLLFTRPTAFDNCTVSLRDSAVTNLAISCGKGTATATWNFIDCANNVATCTQVLNVTPVYGFTVPKIADAFPTCAMGVADINATLEADRRTIINSATLTTLGGVKTCSAPVVETEFWKFSRTQYCQIYRLRYTIIDNCAPFFGYTIGAPGVCNVMLNGDGTRQWGVPNAACTQVASVVEHHLLSHQ